MLKGKRCSNSQCHYAASAAFAAVSRARTDDCVGIFFAEKPYGCAYQVHRKVSGNRRTALGDALLMKRLRNFWTHTWWANDSAKRNGTTRQMSELQPIDANPLHICCWARWITACESQVIRWPYTLATPNWKVCLLAKSTSGPSLIGRPVIANYRIPYEVQYGRYDGGTSNMFRWFSVYFERPAASSDNQSAPVDLKDLG